MIKPPRPSIMFPLAVAVFVVLVTVIIGFAVRSHNRWVDWCEEQGGHVVDHTQVTTTVINGNNGTPTTGTSTSTTYYCLSADGRILDIE